jgi:uncharacterized protein (DUF736 family)
MPTIGTVTKSQNGSFKGLLNTPGIKAEVLIQPHDRKTSEAQPDYRVFSGDVDIGAG